MKKLIYRTLFLATVTVGIGFTSCEKEGIDAIIDNSNSESATKSSIVGTEITYMPTGENLANELVQIVLSNTVSGNSAVTNYADNENDPIPEEGIWMMEAAANYLTNGNFLNSSSDKIFQVNLSVDNYLSGGIIKMNDADMYEKFDEVMTSINERAVTLEMLPKLVDIKLIEITNSQTVLQMYVVYGDDIIVSAAWPATDGFVWESEVELESKITQNLYGQLYQQYVGNAMNGNYSVGANPYFSNVNILNSVINPYLNDIVTDGCPNNDCLWGNDGTGGNLQVSHNYVVPNASSDRLFPASEYPTYYGLGLTLIQNNYNLTTPISNAIGVFGCNYVWNGFPDINQQFGVHWHMIDEIYTGVLHTM